MMSLMHIEDNDEQRTVEHDLRENGGKKHCKVFTLKSKLSKIPKNLRIFLNFLKFSQLLRDISYRKILTAAEKSFL